MMEWIFGRKKSVPKVEDAIEVTQVEDDFIFYPPIPEHNAPVSYPSLNVPSYQPRTSLPPVPSSQAMSFPSFPPALDHSAKHQANPLDSIPFRLSSNLDKNSSHIVPIEVQRLGSFISNARKALDSSELRYDFMLERSVLREASAFNGL